MVIKKHIKKQGNIKVTIAMVGLGVMLYSKLSISQDMPTGASVSSGNVTITGTGSNHLIIDQTSSKSIINWDSFSIHSSGRVDFNQPSSSSFSLNRVQGSTPSSIAGQLNSNGKVMLINPNGVAITPNGVVNTGSFTASTLNIKDKDFINDKFSFEGKGNSTGVVNSGKIRIGGGGHAALLGGYVSNSGTVTARLGKIAMGSGQKITLDFVGDGLMSITVPNRRLGSIKDIKGRTLKSLVNNSGTLKANGGIIKLSAATAKSLSRGSVNIGNSSISVAKSLKNKPGKVVIGSPTNGNIRISGIVDVSSQTALTPSGKVKVQGMQVSHLGEIRANGSTGGGVKILSKGDFKLDGEIFAKGFVDKGGSVQIISGKSINKTKNSLITTSGQNKGGTVRSLAKTTNYTSGSIKANSSKGFGGKIDLSGNQVRISRAKIESKGNLSGGKVRIGGEYQGGEYLTNTVNKNIKGFLKKTN